MLNTYIIVEQGDKVLLIDKHAAHERMNFDRMKAEGYDPMSQTLLAPAVCRLSPEEHAALTARLPPAGGVRLCRGGLWRRVPHRPPGPL